MDSAGLQRLRAARAEARGVAWAHLAETRGGLPGSTAAGLPIPGLTLDLDASIELCHSEKESATRTWKKTFGFHPLFCFLDGTREALSGLLREGRAGSNTTAEHITVLDAALAQIPDAYRYGTPILIRCDSAGCTYGFLTHIRSLREHGIDARSSAGVAITEAIRQAKQWIPAPDADGDLRDGAEICEITDLLPADFRANYPDGTRFIARRERPHPGAQLSLFDTIEGLRHQVMATDTPVGQGSIQFLQARHRGHARVEDRIRCGKDSGFGRFPSRIFAINQAWLELALTGIDLLAWTQHLLLEGETRPRRTQETALPAAARRRPDHPHRPANPTAPRRNLALGR